MKSRFDNPTISITMTPEELALIVEGLDVAYFQYQDALQGARTDLAMQAQLLTRKGGNKGAKSAKKPSPKALSPAMLEELKRKIAITEVAVKTFGELKGAVRQARHYSWPDGEALLRAKAESLQPELFREENGAEELYEGAEEVDE